MLAIRASRLVGAMLLAQSFAYADSLSGRDESKELADRVMAKVAAGEFEAGVRLTAPFAIVPSVQVDEMIEQAKSQDERFADDFGSAIDAEFLGEDKVGENLFRLNYLLRYEKRPAMWRFYFYRGKDGWVLYWMYFDDDIRPLFPQ